MDREDRWREPISVWTDNIHLHWKRELINWIQCIMCNHKGEGHGDIKGINH